MRQYIAYYRISVEKKGKTQGLSFEAQKAVVEQYISRNAGTLIAEYSEVQTGTGKKRRVEVFKAISHARKEKAILIVAKLDRLARDVEFMAAVQKMAIDIVFCDFPQANKLVIGIMALIAEYEAGLISQRTKDALKALKARGVTLGNPNIGQLAGRGAAARAANQELNQTANKAVLGLILSAKSDKKTFPQIATMLNDQNLRTTLKKEFTADNVRMLYSNATKSLSNLKPQK